MENEKYLFVVSGAAGTGKDSVVKALREAHPEIEKTVSATTRSPRPGEQEGVDYYYRTQEQFRQLIDTDQVVEYNFYNGNYYGTLREEVDKRLVKEARERGMLIDASYGRSTRAVLVMDSDHVVLSALTPETVAGRAAGQPEGKTTEEEQ